MNDSRTPPDPFLRAVRQRHPDADLVLLPPVVADLPEASEAEATERVDRARASLASLYSRIGRTPTSSVELWWHQGLPDVHRLVVRASFRDLRTGTAVPLLRDVGEALLAEGWVAGPVPGERPALEAATRGQRLTAAAYPHSVDLELTSAPLRMPSGSLPDLGPERGPEQGPDA